MGQWLDCCWTTHAVGGPTCPSCAKACSSSFGARAPSNLPRLCERAYGLRGPSRSWLIESSDSAGWASRNCDACRRRRSASQISGRSWLLSWNGSSRSTTSTTRGSRVPSRSGKPTTEILEDGLVRAKLMRQDLLGLHADDASPELRVLLLRGRDLSSQLVEQLTTAAALALTPCGSGTHVGCSHVGSQAAHRPARGE